MVEITQTETDIKIIINLINIRSKKPDVVLLTNYVKFNLHPVFFEGYLTKDIIESESTFKLFKREARLILKKKECGIWDPIFKVIPRTEALERRKEMVNALQSKNAEIDKELLKRYDEKKKAEVAGEIKRDAQIREKFESANNREIEGFSKVEPENPTVEPIKVKNLTSPPIETVRRRIIPKNEIRSSGKIKINFTKFAFKTPKRESQDQWQADVQAEALRRSMKIV